MAVPRLRKAVCSTSVPPLNQPHLRLASKAPIRISTLRANFDLQNATFNAHLSNLVVGEKTSGGSGTVTANVAGGSSGDISIGAPGHTANFIVAHADISGHTTATVDFGGQSSLTANLDNLLIGTSEGGIALGQLTLAKTNNIDANTIRVGYSTTDATSPTNALVFGTQNSVTVAEFTIGGPLSTGIVTITSGGSLNLGTSVKPVNLYLARSNINTNADSTGVLDMTGATLNAFLGTTILGEKTGGGSGHAMATFTTGSQGDIVGQNFELGVGSGSGTLNFNGGTLTADSIAKGTGSAEFNWAAGTLHVGTFGTPAIPFNLSNVGTGILAPGDESRYHECLWQLQSRSTCIAENRVGWADARQRLRSIDRFR